MEDDLNVLKNGRRPQCFGKWNTTSIQDPNWKMTSKFWQMKDDLNFLEKGRQPHFFENGKLTQFSENER